MVNPVLQEFEPDLRSRERKECYKYASLYDDFNESFEISLMYFVFLRKSLIIFATQLVGGALLKMQKYFEIMRNIFEISCE